MKIAAGPVRGNEKNIALVLSTSRCGLVIPIDRRFWEETSTFVGLVGGPRAPICAEDGPQQILTVGFVVRLGLSIALALAIIASEASATEAR